MNTNSYFTIEILSSGNLWLRMFNANGSEEYVTVYYWINKDPNSTRDNYDGVITTTTSAQNIPISVGDKIRLYRAETTAWAGSDTDKWYNRIGGSAEINISGNMASLIGFSETIPAYCFRYLFYSSQIIDASRLELPWTTLNDYCFCRTFQNSTKLIKGPILKNVTLASRCYQWLYLSCSSLNSITCLQKNPDNSFNTWVNGVAATGVFIKDVDTTWSTGNSGIPSGWTIKNANQYTQFLDFNDVNAVYVKGNIGISAIYGQNNQLIWSKN